MSCYCRSVVHVVSCYCRSVDHVVSCYCRSVAHVVSCYCRSVVHVLSCYCRSVVHVVSCYCRSVVRVVSCYCRSVVHVMSCYCCLSPCCVMLLLSSERRQPVYVQCQAGCCLHPWQLKILTQSTLSPADAPVWEWSPHWKFPPAC